MSGWNRNWRLESTPGRGVYGERAYGPYGTAYAGGGPLGFTDKWNDAPDGLYDFPYRYESPGLKRWLSPDPAGVAAVDLADPQSWDAYAYVNNQPLANIDPTGLVCQPDQINQDCEPGFSQGSGGYGGGGWYGGDGGGGGEFDLESIPVYAVGYSWQPIGAGPSLWGQGYFAETSIWEYLPFSTLVGNGLDLYSSYPFPAEPLQSADTVGPAAGGTGSFRPPSGPSCGGILAQGAIQTGLDVVSALPLAGEIFASVRVGAMLGSTSLSLVGADGVGTSFGLTGIGVEALDRNPGLIKAGAEDIPFIGRAFAVGAAGWDIFSAVRNYAACRE